MRWSITLLFGSLAVLLCACDDKSSSPSSNEITDTKYVGAAHDLIIESGYECPHITELWFVGLSPNGPKLESLCGEIGTTDSRPELHYTIYPDHLKVVVCKPFGMFAGGCE